MNTEEKPIFKIKRKVDSKGRITIPMDKMIALQIKNGDMVTMQIWKDKIVITKENWK